MSAMLQVFVRAYPFDHLSFHGRNRQDFIVWRTPYCEIESRDLDPSNPAHADKLGYGKVILLFKCRIQPTKNSAATTHDLAFIEELWPYTPPRSMRSHQSAPTNKRKSLWLTADRSLVCLCAPTCAFLLILYIERNACQLHVWTQNTC